MKYAPRRNQIIGRIVIKRTLKKIIRPDETANTSKFVLIDAIGPEAEAAGLKVGDIVIPIALSNIVLDGGASFRPLLEERSVAAIVVDASLDEFVIQTDNGSEFVPMDHENAAQSFGAFPRTEHKPEAA